MIRKTWNADKWLLTAQPEHARLSAILASGWKFPGAKPHEEVVKAIMSHDDGWKEHDAAPQIKPNGDPRDFMEMKLADSTDIFMKSIEARIDSGQLYGAALVCGHFLALAMNADLARASTADAIAAGRFIARQRQQLTALKALAAENETTAAALENFDTDLRFLQVCDYISLKLCGDFTGEETITNVPYLEKGDSLKISRTSNSLALSLSPLPFKKNLRDHLTSWIVPNMPYESTEELQAAMAEVKTTVNEVHLGAGNG